MYPPFIITLARVLVKFHVNNKQKGLLSIAEHVC